MPRFSAAMEGCRTHSCRRCTPSAWRFSISAWMASPGPSAARARRGREQRGRGRGRRAEEIASRVCGHGRESSVRTPHGTPPDAHGVRAAGAPALPGSRSRGRRRPAPDLSAVLRPLRPLVGRAAGARRPPRRSRRLHRAQHARPARIVLRRAPDRRGGRAHQLPPDRRGLRLPHPAQRGQGRLRPLRLPGGGGHDPRPDPGRDGVRGARIAARGLAGLRGHPGRGPRHFRRGPRSARATSSPSTTRAAPPRGPRA